MSNKEPENIEPFKWILEGLSPRQFWGFVFVNLVLIDTLLTKFALQNSLGVEANAVMAPFVNEGKFTIILFGKAFVVITTAFIIERYKEDRLTDRMLRYYIFTISGFIVLWNGVNIFGSILFG